MRSLLKANVNKIDGQLNPFLGLNTSHKKDVYLKTNLNILKKLSLPKRSKEGSLEILYRDQACHPACVCHLILLPQPVKLEA